MRPKTIHIITDTEILTGYVCSIIRLTSNDKSVHKLYTMASVLMLRGNNWCEVFAYALRCDDIISIDKKFYF